MFVTSVTSLKFIQNMTEENDKPKLRLPDWIEVQLNKSKTKCPDCMSPINNYKPKDIVRSIGIRKSSMTERIDSTVLFCEIRCPKCNYDFILEMSPIDVQEFCIITLGEGILMPFPSKIDNNESKINNIDLLNMKAFLETNDDYYKFLKFIGLTTEQLNEDAHISLGKNDNYWEQKNNDRK